MKYIPSIAFEEMSGSEKKEDLKQVFRTGGRNYTVEKAWTEWQSFCGGEKGPACYGRMGIDLPHPILIFVAATKR